MMADKPKRIQRQRKKGWRMPEGAVYVGRPTKWGNPFTKDDNPLANTDYGLIEHDCGESWRAQVVFCFAWWFGYLSDEEKSDLLEPLRGKDLACWCPLDQPCHADILLELANS